MALKGRHIKKPKIFGLKTLLLADGPRLAEDHGDLPGPGQRSLRVFERTANCAKCWYE